MPLGNVVGKIVDPRKSAYVLWQIPGVSEISLKEDYYLESPRFYFLNRCWCLRFYPHGDSQSIGWYAVYLIERKATSSCDTLALMIGLKFLQEDIILGPETHTFTENDYSYGWTKIFKAAEICNQLRSPYDMIISCDITSEIPSSTRAIACQTMYRTIFVISESQNLNLDDQSSDATVKVQGHEFKVHKLVLETHSDVLSTMLKHMTEKNESLINIDDCDPEIFDTFLQFMYTGKVKNLSSDNVNRLYAVADKYSVSHLKIKCAEFMELNMSKDTACDVLIIAEKHKDTDLKLLAEKFLIDNIDTILPTKRWISFMGENKSLARDIFMKIASSSGSESE